MTTQGDATPGQRYIATQFYKADSPQARMFDGTGIVPTEFVLASDHHAALAAANEKHRFGSCEVCWNMAWVPCPESEPNAVPMKCSNGTTYWRCDYCWMKQQLAAARAEAVALRTALKGALLWTDEEHDVDDWRTLANQALATVPPQPTPGGE